MKPEWLDFGHMAMSVAASPASPLMQEIARGVIIGVLSGGLVLYVSDARQDERLKNIDNTVSKIELRLQRMEGDIYRPRWQNPPAATPH